MFHQSAGAHASAEQTDLSCSLQSIEISDAKVAESDQEKKDIILDYDEAGNIIGIEILNASKITKQPNGISYEVA